MECDPEAKNGMLLASLDLLAKIAQRKPRRRSCIAAPRPHPDLADRAILEYSSGEQPRSSTQCRRSSSASALAVLADTILVFNQVAALKRFAESL
jgi:hypothetical protein